ncbi:methyltransferase [Candidatus Woesearchaeota archaeon]|nr:methyltransferase [Candidatus Woesearchaeota archaeon]MBW3005658.1 methyltransferase [Candidatus Woesearchaeota archaeon]
MEQHYYSEQPESELKPRKIQAKLKKKSFEFWTGSGVFSPRRVDPATELLIENAVVNKQDKVLDLCAGYGPIGIAVKKIFPDTQVFLTDINKRATNLAKKNSKLNKTKVTIKSGDLYEPYSDEKFDVILVNPPIAAGRTICYKIIEEAITHLNKEGTLQLVARHQKGGRMLEKKMQEVFGNVETLAKKGGFRVYLSVYKGMPKN